MSPDMEILHFIVAKIETKKAVVPVWHRNRRPLANHNSFREEMTCIPSARDISVIDQELYSFR
jgi:hypothetical protein